jgi:hypothetical protein
MDESEENLSDLRDAHFVYKPYNISDVNTAIRKMLAQKYESVSCA